MLVGGCFTIPQPTVLIKKIFFFLSKRGGQGMVKCPRPIRPLDYTTLKELGDGVTTLMCSREEWPTFPLLVRGTCDQPVHPIRIIEPTFKE
jgi:hypothetical protein